MISLARNNVGLAFLFLVLALVMNEFKTVHSELLFFYLSKLVDEDSGTNNRRCYRKVHVHLKLLGLGYRTKKPEN